MKSYTTNNGLANNIVKGIVEDNQGMLWIATDNGLSIFNPKTEAFCSFSREDGLISSQFYFNGAIRNAKGEIFLGTDAGMMAVKGINRSVHQTGKLCFTELLVDNQPVFAGSDYLEEDISIAKSCVSMRVISRLPSFLSAQLWQRDTGRVPLSHEGIRE